MQKLATGMLTHKSKSGFTLIEILIVIVIIGIIASVAIISYGDFGARRRVISSADNFINFFGLVQKEAMLEGRAMAIQVHKDKYRALEFKQNHWLPLQDSIFKSQKVAHGTLMYLFINKRKSKRDIIIINPAGDITPFQLKFGKDRKNIVVTIIGQQGGNLRRDDNAK